MAYTVYVLHDQDGKVYVGVTSTPVDIRWNNGNGYRFCRELWEKIKSQGWESIRKEIVATDLDKASASKLEQQLIVEHDSTNPLKGYNRELGGLTTDKKFSEASRERMSKSKVGELNPNYGKHLSEDHRKKIAESNQGVKRSMGTCIKIGKAKEKPVAQYSRTGELIAVFESGEKASLATGVPAYHISRVCRHQRADSGEYKWSFV